MLVLYTFLKETRHGTRTLVGIVQTFAGTRHIAVVRGNKVFSIGRSWPFICGR